MRRFASLSLKQNRRGLAVKDKFFLSEGEVIVGYYDWKCDRLCRA